MSEQETRHELWERIQALSWSVHELGSVIQNPVAPSRADITELASQIGKVKALLIAWEQDTINFLTKEGDLT